MNVPTGISSNSDIVAGKFVMIIGSPKVNNPSFQHSKNQFEILSVSYIQFPIALLCSGTIIGGSCSVTLVVAFVFLPQIFGRWWGPVNGTLSFYECRLSGGDT